MSDDLDEAFDNAVMDRVSRVERGEDLIAVYGKTRTNLGEFMAISERDSDYRHLALKYLSSLITPPNDGEWSISVSSNYDGFNERGTPNLSPLQQAVAMACCIQDGSLEDAANHCVELVASLPSPSLVLKPAPDIEAVLAEACQKLVDCHVGGCSAEVKEAWLTAESALEKRDRAALALRRNKPQDVPHAE